MAVSTMDRALVILMVVCVLTSLVADVAEARRGGGRGGSRGSSGRGRTKTTSGSRSKTKTTNYRNVALSGRIVKGSSPYTKNNWRAAAAGGLIFGGVAYLAMNRHRSYIKMPTICTNNYEKSPEGRTYGNFICPLTSNAANETYCCGKEHREYCCDKYTAQKYYAEHHRSSSSSPVGTIIGLLVFVGIICGIVYCCKKKNGPLFRMCGKKKDDRLNGMTLSQAVNPESPYGPHQQKNDLQPPMYGPAPMPSPGYGGTPGLPYAPPPVGFEATPGAPYPGSAPYPPPQAPGVAPHYPAPVGGAPYPPTAPVPYPPPSDPHAPSPYPVGPPPSYPGVDNSTAPPYPGGGYPVAAPPYNASAPYPAYGSGDQSKA